MYSNAPSHQRGTLFYTFCRSPMNLTDTLLQLFSMYFMYIRCFVMTFPLRQSPPKVDNVKSNQM